MTLPDFLTQDPDGEIHMTGHRIGLYTVVRVYTEGYSAEMISEEFPSLPLDLVQQVIAFYLENRAEVDVYVADYRAELERQEAAYVPSPGAIRIRGLLQRIHEADAKYGADPGWSSLCVVEKLRRIEEENPEAKV